MFTYPQSRNPCYSTNYWVATDVPSSGLKYNKWPKESAPSFFTYYTAGDSF